MPPLSQRVHDIDASGIRRMFDLAANLKDPINLSIGQPDYDTPEPIKEALCRAVRQGHNGYSPTQGIAPLLDRLRERVRAEYGHPDRELFVTSGTSGALVLVLASCLDPGDEVIIFDPYFVMYRHLVTLFGGKPVFVETYPDFEIDLDRVASAVTPRTKAILFNSPANPTGAMPPAEQIRDLAELARRKDLWLLSDEIYRQFSFDGPFVSPAAWNDRVVVIDGFSKAWSMTGHRCGWAHGPREIIEQMKKVQQYSFVCAPHPVQWAALEALEFDIADFREEYRAKRDLIRGGLEDLYDIRGAAGAFYLFVKAPWGTATEFTEAALERNLLIIPGHVFSERDTHFRISYAASQKTLEEGVAILRELATQGPEARSGG